MADDLVAMGTASPPSGTLMTGINKPYVQCASQQIILIFCDDVTVWSPIHADVNHSQINIGRDFQAEIPPLRGQKKVRSDSHNALLLWTTWGELETPVSQQRGSHAHKRSHYCYNHDSYGTIFWWTHCLSSWSSVNDGSLQCDTRGRGQPGVRHPCPVRMQRRLPGKISLAVWSFTLNCELGQIFELFKTRLKSINTHSKICKMCVICFRSFC